jgi:hypothetical protein
LNEKQQIKKKQNKIASEIQNLNMKCYCSQPAGLASSKSWPAAYLRHPHGLWAQQPTAGPAKRPSAAPRLG